MSGAAWHVERGQVTEDAGEGLQPLGFPNGLSAGHGARLIDVLHLMSIEPTLVMIERVRPAQFTTTSVSGLGAKSFTR